MSISNPKVNVSERAAVHAPATEPDLAIGPKPRRGPAHGASLTTTRVLVVGTGMTADRIMPRVRQDPRMTLVGRAVHGDGLDAGAIGRVADLRELCRQLDVHRLLVAPSDSFSAESLDVYRQLQDFVHIAAVSRYSELISWRSRFSAFEDTWAERAPRHADVVGSLAVLAFAFLVVTLVRRRLTAPIA